MGGLVSKNGSSSSSSSSVQHESDPTDSQFNKEKENVSLDKFASDSDVRHVPVVLKQNELGAAASRYEKNENKPDEIEELIADLGLNSQNSFNKKSASSSNSNNGKKNDKSSALFAGGTHRGHGAKIVFSQNNSNNNFGQNTSPLVKNKGKTVCNPLQEELDGTDVVSLERFNEAITKLCSGCVLAPLGSIFAVLDKDKDGKLKGDELSTAVKVLAGGDNTKQEQGKLLLDAFDENRDGYLTSAELDRAISIHIQHPISRFVEAFDFCRVEAEVFQESVTISALQQAVESIPGNRLRIQTSGGNSATLELNTSVGTVQVSISMAQLLQEASTDAVGRLLEELVIPVVVSNLGVTKGTKYKISDLIIPLTNVGFTRWLLPLSNQVGVQQQQQQQHSNAMIAGTLTTSFDLMNDIDDAVSDILAKKSLKR